MTTKLNQENLLPFLAFFFLSDLKIVLVPGRVTTNYGTCLWSNEAQGITNTDTGINISFKDDISLLKSRKVSYYLIFIVTLL